MPSDQSATSGRHTPASRCCSFERECESGLRLAFAAPFPAALARAVAFAAAGLCVEAAARASVKSVKSIRAGGGLVKRHGNGAAKRLRFNAPMPGASASLSLSNSRHSGIAAVRMASRMTAATCEALLLWALARAPQLARAARCQVAGKL